MIGAVVSGASSLLDGFNPWVHAVFDPLHLSGVGNYWQLTLASLFAHKLLLKSLPAISAALFPRAYGQLSRTDKQAWCVSLTTLAHSVYDTWFILKFIGHPALNANKMDGFNEEFERYLAIALGYYVWDLSTCLRNFAEYGIMYLIHGGLGVFGLLILTSRQLQFYAIPFLLPELSSIFLHIRHLLKYAGYAHTLVYKVNFIVFTCAYVAIRIGFEAYHSARLVVEVWGRRTGEVFYPFAVFFAILGVTLTTLNVIWLRQIIYSAYYTIYPKTKSKAS
ncbi:hypothetical protein IWW51_004039 [Coemansia sp. RSA 2702]|nr:hypothetical protein IWW52_001992 [Coemansia sp. RSA 2704]KAJ2322847.1 hypothetical protein IWW51_004039 [Coemansia sp. RSA 2702]